MASGKVRRARFEHVQRAIDCSFRIFSARRASNVTPLHRYSSEVIGSTLVQIGAPYGHCLNSRQQRHYLRTLLTPRTDRLPFQIDVWTPHNKVMNVEYFVDGSVEIVSLRPGPWIDELQAEADNLPIIVPAPRVRSIISKARKTVPHCHSPVVLRRLLSPSVTVSKDFMDRLRDFVLAPSTPPTRSAFDNLFDLDAGSDDASQGGPDAD